MKVSYIKRKALEERNKEDITFYFNLAKHQMRNNYKGAVVKVPTNISEFIEKKLDEEGIPCCIPIGSFVNAGDTIRLYVAGTFSLLETYMGV